MVSRLLESSRYKYFESLALVPAISFHISRIETRAFHSKGSRKRTSSRIPYSHPTLYSTETRQTIMASKQSSSQGSKPPQNTEMQNPAQAERNKRDEASATLSSSGVSNDGNKKNAVDLERLIKLHAEVLERTKKFGQTPEETRSEKK